jgi:hypothetical protein
MAPSIRLGTQLIDWLVSACDPIVPGLLSVTEDEAAVSDLLRRLLDAVDRGDDATAAMWLARSAYARIGAVIHLGPDGLSGWLRAATCTVGGSVRAHLVGATTLDIHGDEALIAADMRVLDLGDEWLGVSVWRLRAFAERRKTRWLIGGLLFDQIRSEAHVAR